MGIESEKRIQGKEIYYFICRLQTNPYKDIVRIDKQTNTNCYVRWDGIVKFCQIGLHLILEMNIK